MPPVKLPDQLIDCSCRYISGYRTYIQGACGSHNHENFEIVYHPSGCGTTQIEKSQKIEFREGSVVMYAPCVYHDQVMSAPGIDVVLHVEFPKSISDNLPQYWYIPEIIDPFILQELRLLPEAHPSRTPIQQQILDHRITAVLMALFQLNTIYDKQANSPAEYYSERACQYLRQHYKTITHVDEVANSLNISPSYLRYLYRMHFGTSLVDSLTSLRIERAQDLLRNPELTLSAIATDCGFANERYFSTVFKKSVGCTPGQFRKRLMFIAP